MTNAKPGQSYHNFGLAIDFFTVSDDGKKANWTVNSKWQRVAAIGKDLGFKWGGDWSSFKDYPHLEMTGGLSYSQLQAGKEPHLTFKFEKTDLPKTSKGDTYIISIQNTLNSRYKAAISVDGFYGPETRSALIKAIQTELNKQFNKKLAVDGKWGPKTKTAIVTVKKELQAISHGFSKQHFTWKDLTLGPLTQNSVRIQRWHYLNTRRQARFLQISKQVKKHGMNCLLDRECR